VSSIPHTPNDTRAIRIDRGQGAPSRDRGPLKGGTVWWLRPAPALLAFVLPTAFGAFLIPAQDYLINWGTLKYFDAPALFSVMAAILVMSVPAFIVGRAARQSTPGSVWTGQLKPSEQRFAMAAFKWLLGLTILGYAIWVFLALSRGVSVAELRALFSDQTSAFTLKATLSPVTGLTTLTQFGMAAAGLGTFLYLKTRARRVRRGVILIVLLAAARALIYSERLALIEVSIAVLVVSAQFSITNGGPRVRRRLALLPLIAVPMLLLIFAGFEYTRSWHFYAAQSTQPNLVTFSAERLEGYYATSYNNGVIANQAFWPPTQPHVPYFTVGFFWDFPLLKGEGYQAVAGIDPVTRWVQVLTVYGNPEFNNYGGISAPIADLGLPLGLVFCAIAGIVLAIVYLHFARGSPLGIMLYPILFIGLVDLPREFYWGSGRAFPSLVAALVVGGMWARRRREGHGAATHAKLLVAR
jgi:oligosaccharide repeat unit polymerase